jgi:DNA-binding protein H-NS
MLTNEERYAQIEAVRQQFIADRTALERRFKDESLQLERLCTRRVAELENDIKAYAAQELRAAREEVQAILKRSGIDPAIILASIAVPREKAPAKERKQMKPSTVLHHGPEGKVWNGRGRVPGWFKARQATPSAQHTAH